VAKLQPKLVAVAKAAAPKVAAKVAAKVNKSVMAGEGEFPMDDDFREF